MNGEYIQVLLAEREPENAVKLSSVLRRLGLEGYRLIHLCDYDDLLENIESRHFDVCFVDQGIGGDSELNGRGYELLEKMREHQPYASLIMWSRQEDAEMELHALRSGLADFSIRGEIDSSVVERNLSYAIHRCRWLAEIRRMRAAEQELFDNAIIGIFQTSKEGKYLRGNPALARIYGYEDICEMQAELTNIEHQLYVNPNRRKRFQELLKKNGSVENFESEVYRRDGRIIWISEHARHVLDEDGKLLYYEGFVEDITKRKESEALLVYEATHDHLTGLPNRVLLRDRLEQAIRHYSRHPERDFAVMFLDLNRFKIINDSMGHEAGDQLIQAVAHRLKDLVRTGDTVARLGGDEFAILLDEVENLDHVIEIAERLHEELQNSYLVHEREVYVGAAIGIAQMKASYQNVDDLLRDADTAMYLAKSEMMPYKVFDPGMHIQAVKRLDLETDLRKALEDEDFHVHYQPMVDLENMTIAGFEALVRWEHPTLGNVSPAEFIPIAEETGLIVDMDWLVLRKACKQCAIWNRSKLSDRPLTISVNVTVRDLVQPEYAKRLEAILQEAQLSPELLHLELVEGSTMGLADQILPSLNLVTRLGVGLMIDDFGTGYSSMARLHELPFGYLKVDRTFVQSVGQEERSMKILNTIMLLSKALEMKTIAEGIETDAQLRWARTHHCSYAQGYYFCRPLAAERIEGLLRQEWAKKMEAIAI